MLFSIWSNLDAIWEIIAMSLLVVLSSSVIHSILPFPLYYFPLFFSHLFIGLEALDEFDELKIDIEVFFSILDMWECSFEGPAITFSSCVFNNKNGVSVSVEASHFEPWIYPL